MAVFNGSDLVLLVNTTDDDHFAFAHSQSVSLSYSCEVVEVTLDDSNSWTQYIPGRKSTNISFSGLTDYGTVVDRKNIQDLSDYFLDQDELYLQFKNNNRYFHGTAYVSDISIESGVDDVCTYTGTLTLITELTSELDIETTLEALQDSSGNDIMDSEGNVLMARIPV